MWHFVKYYVCITFLYYIITNYFLHIQWVTNIITLTIYKTEFKADLPRWEDERLGLRAGVGARAKVRPRWSVSASWIKINNSKTKRGVGVREWAKTIQSLRSKRREKMISCKGRAWDREWERTIFCFMIRGGDKMIS